MRAGFAVIVLSQSFFQIVGGAYVERFVFAF